MLATAAAVGGLTSLASAGVVFFDSFEGDLGLGLAAPGGYTQYDAPNTLNSVMTWAVGAGPGGGTHGVDQITTGYSPTPFPDGVSALDMNGLDTGSITTTMNTTAGQAYRMSFWAAGNGTGLSGSVLGAADSASGTFFSDSSVWQMFTLDFVAGGNTAIISFTALTPPGSGGLTLDAVSVSTIPLPTGAAAGLAGLAGLGLIRRRRVSVL